MTHRENFYRMNRFEKNGPDKNIRFHPVKQYGRLIKNVRLNPIGNLVTSVRSSSCIFSRVLDPLGNKFKKCNRTESFGKLVKMTSQKRTSSCQETDETPKMSVDKEISDHKKFLAMLTYSRFLKKAWKNRKELTEIQEVYLKSSKAQISNLKLQVTSLKHLLSSDELMMRTSLQEIKSLKGLLSSLQEEYDTLKAEKERLAERSELLKEELLNTKTELKNGQNNYLLVKSEATAFEVQLEKERTKIAQLKKDNRLLLSGKRYSRKQFKW